MRSATKESKPPVRRITDDPAYTEAVKRCDRAKLALDQASQLLNTLMARSASATEELKTYLHNLSSGMRVIPAVSEAVFDDMARKVAEQGSIDDQLMRRLRFGAPSAAIKDEWDAERAQEIGDATRSIQLLKRGADLLEREVLRQKNLAIADVLSAAQSERERISRGIADAVLELAIKLGEEKSFVEGLRAQDESIPGLLRPPACPVELRSDLVVGWLAAVLGISEAEVQSRMARASSIEKNFTKATAGEPIQ